MRCFLKKYCSLLAKIVTYSKKFCWSYMIIGHDYIHLFVLKLFISKAEECDVTQFNQLNLNSSFSHLAINSLINLLIYLQKWKQLLRFRLLYNIKVIEDTVRQERKSIIKTEFSPMNCPLSPLTPCPRLIGPVKCLLMNLKII